MPGWQCDRCTRRQVNVFSAEKCSRCGTENFCMLEEPEADVLDDAKQGWLKLDEFGRQGDHAGTPGYLQPKSLVTLLHAIPQSERNRCVFVDLGCGPGHALCVAQHLGFLGLAGIDTADCSAVFNLNKSTCFGSKCPLHVKFKQDCVEVKSWVPDDWKEPWVIYLFWATWVAETKEKVITLLGQRKERVRFLVLVDYTKELNGHRRTLPRLLDVGFEVYGYKTCCIMGGSGRGRFTGIILCADKEAQGRRVGVVNDENSDGMIFVSPR